MYYPSIHSSSCPLPIPHLSTYVHIRPPILFYVNHRNKVPEPQRLNQDIYFYTSGNISQGANEVSGEGSRLLLHMAVSIWPFFCLYVERKIPGVCFCFYRHNDLLNPTLWYHLTLITWSWVFISKQTLIGTWGLNYINLEESIVPITHITFIHQSFCHSFIFFNLSLICFFLN